MQIQVLDAPTNLGLRAPSPGTVPGCYKLPWALRDRGLLARLGAVDAGAVVPARYDLSGWAPGDGCFNAAAIANYSLALAGRVESLVPEGFLLVLGGECSLVLGVTLGLRRLGRYGLVYLDAHTDYRHPGNAEALRTPVGAAGGEALALVTGFGQPDLTGLDDLRPYVRPEAAVLAGLHEVPDVTHPEVRHRLAGVFDVGQLRELGSGAAAALLACFEPDLDGLWIHVDADVLDPSVMPAVDSPEPGGLLPDELATLIAGLVAGGRVAGLDIGIYDPDREPPHRSGPDGAQVLVEVLVAGLSGRSTPLSRTA